MIASDVVCLPWMAWGLAITCDAAIMGGAQRGYRPDALVVLMILVCAAPVWLVAWSYRRSWFIRWLWPLALLVAAASLADHAGLLDGLDVGV